jgi:hypothetical protein
MKKNFIFMAIMAITALSVFTSCKDDDPKAIIPHLGSVSISPATSEPGAERTATVTFDRKGENIQGHYQYTILKIYPGSGSFGTGSFQTTPTDSYSFTFNAPIEPGTYSIKIVCTKVDTYVGSLYYMGNMSDIGTITTTFFVTEGE